MNALSSIFGSACEISINFENEGAKPKVTLYQKKKPTELVKFVGNEDVKGVIRFNVPNGKKIEHLGITLEFIGQIIMFYDRGNHFDFTTLSQEIRVPGVLTESFDFPFHFPCAEKPYESYNGTNVRLRYFVRVNIARNYSGNITKEREIFVVNYQKPPEQNLPIEMEVGIENCIHIKFEYNKSKFHLRDVVIGKVNFVLVRTKIKYMELSLLRKEISGQVPNVYTETECLTKYEIMDGAPVKGEVLPVRLFLRQFDMTPTYRNISSKFSVKYFLNLVLFDTEDRRYFKQQEINLWRRKPKNASNVEDDEIGNETVGTITLDEYRVNQKKKPQTEKKEEAASSSSTEDESESESEEEEHNEPAKKKEKENEK